MGIAINAEAPLFISAVSAEKYAWHDIQPTGRVRTFSDLYKEVQGRSPIAETNESSSSSYVKVSLFDAPSQVTVRGLTDSVTLLSGKPRDKGRAYAPVEEKPQLFRAFAELDRSEKAIRDFANEYGLLGFFDSTSRLKLPERGYLHESVVIFERPEDWLRAITEMHCALTLYEAFTQNHSKVQAQLISSDDGGFKLSFDSNYPELDQFLMPSRYSPVMWERIEQDYLLLFKIFFRNIVNKNLDDYCSARLNLIGDISDSNFDTQYAPMNLLGAMWLQVALMAERKVIYKKCSYCGRAIEVAGRYAKSNIVYCKSGKNSSSCRTKASVQRKQKTLELSSQGLEVADIAQAVDSTPEQVARWIETAEIKQKPS